MKRATIGVAAVLAAAGAAAGQAQFFGLGDLPGGGFISQAYAVSGDGSTAVGESLISGAPPFGGVYGAFRWRGAPMQPLYTPTSGETSRAYAVSADGETVIGWVDYGFSSTIGTQATIFENGSFLMLGDLPGGTSKVPRSFGRGVSADGRFIVGIGESVSGPEAFRYDRMIGTMEPLGDLPGGGFASYAYAIQGNGGFVVGESESGAGERQACYWTPATGIHPLGFMATGAGIVRSSTAVAISENGNVIAGSSRSLESGNGQQACIWVGGGEPQGLGDLPTGSFQSMALAVSGDGKRVVGRGYIDGPCGPFGCTSKPRAFVWSQQSGMVDIQQLLVGSYGLNLTGWDLSEATGISRDGRVIVGNGSSPNGVEAWMAVIPWVSCYPDCNGDGAVNLADFGCFQTKFALGDPYADCNGDLQLNLSDFGCFQTKFALGCQ